MDWQAIARHQAGALARPQALDGGLSSSAWDRRLGSGLWQPMHPGVAATFSGPVPDVTRVWGAVLWAGAGALASHETAAWLDGWLDRPQRLTVTVPATRTPRARPGLRIVRTRDEGRLTAPPRQPPRTRTEETVLDLVDAALRPEQVVDAVLRACQHRRTTPDRLLVAAAQRPRLRWRALVVEVLSDAAEGVATALERHWFRDVEVPHGLPRGERNSPDDVAGRRAYRDVRYRQWRLVVELDGRVAHPPERAHLDRARDRLLALGADVTLRYGWREVLGTPCASAVELSTGLGLGGWPGTPRACGARCAVLVAAA